MATNKHKKKHYSQLSSFFQDQTHIDFQRVSFHSTKKLHPIMIMAKKLHAYPQEERGAQRLQVFELEELCSATNGFSRALKVGEGGFNSVYRAFFRSSGGGRVILAIKRLNQRSLQSVILLIAYFNNGAQLNTEKKLFSFRVVSYMDMESGFQSIESFLKVLSSMLLALCYS